MEVVFLSEVNDIEICGLDKEVDIGWQKNKREVKIREMFFLLKISFLEFSYWQKVLSVREFLKNILSYMLKFMKQQCVFFSINFFRVQIIFFV